MVEQSSSLSLTDEVLHRQNKDLQALQTWLSNREGDDISISFVFSQSDVKPIQILSSRLEYAGGPLAAIAKQPFAEQSSKQVQLSGEDDPVTFAAIRDFLYMNPIHPILQSLWDDVTIEAIMKVISAAHRWQLHSLFGGFCKLLCSYDMLVDLGDVLYCLEIAQLPDVPKDVLIYFWTAVGKYYPCITPQLPIDDDQISQDQSELIDAHVQDNILNWKHSKDIDPCQIASPPTFPDLWVSAIAQNMVNYLLHSIITHMSMRIEDDQIEEEFMPLYFDHLETIVLGFLEPKISDDNTFLNVLSQLRWRHARWMSLLQNKTSYERYSSRAIALVARNMMSLNVPRDEVRASWEINLHSMDETYDLRKHFLYPMSQMHSKCQRCNYSKVSRDPLRAECKAGIAFTVTAVEQDSGFHIETVWSIIGLRMSGKDYTTTKVAIRIIDDECMCPRRHPKENDGGDVLVEEHFHLLEERDSSCLCFSGKLLKEYRETHTSRCRATISIVVSND